MTDRPQDAPERRYDERDDPEVDWCESDTEGCHDECGECGYCRNCEGCECEDDDAGH